MSPALSQPIPFPPPPDEGDLSHQGSIFRRFNRRNRSRPSPYSQEIGHLASMSAPSLLSPLHTAIHDPLPQRPPLRGIDTNPPLRTSFLEESPASGSGVDEAGPSENDIYASRSPLRTWRRRGRHSNGSSPALAMNSSETTVSSAQSAGGSALSPATTGTPVLTPSSPNPPYATPDRRETAGGRSSSSGPPANLLTPPPSSPEGSTLPAWASTSFLLVENGSGSRQKQYPMTPPSTGRSNSHRRHLSFTSPARSDSLGGVHQKLNPRSQPLWDFLTTDDIRRGGDLGKQKAIEGVKEWLRDNLMHNSRMRDLSKELEVLKGELPDLPIYREIFNCPEIELGMPPKMHRYPPLMSDYNFFTISKSLVVDCLLDANEHYSRRGSPEIPSVRSRPSPPSETSALRAPGSRLPSVTDGSPPNPQAQEKRLPAPPSPMATRTPTKTEASRPTRPLKPRRPSTIMENPDASESDGVDTLSDLDLASDLSSFPGSPLAPIRSRSSLKAHRLLGITSEIDGDDEMYSEQAQSPVAAPEVVKTGFFRRAGKKADGKIESKSKGQGIKIIAAAFLGSSNKPKSKSPALEALSQATKDDRRWETRSAPARDSRSIRSRSNAQPTVAPRRKEVHPSVTGQALVTQDSISPRQGSIRSSINPSRGPDRLLRELHRDQVSEVILSWIFKRMRGAGEGRQRGVSTETNPAIAYAKGKQGNKPEPSGASNLEAVVLKLLHIKFELLNQCESPPLPAIVSAIDNVRFMLGFCSPGQLVSKLCSMTSTLPSNDLSMATGGSHLGPKGEAKAKDMMNAWIRLRTECMSRWDAARLVKEEVLSKLPPGGILQELLQAAMVRALLPSTPFPPRLLVGNPSKQQSSSTAAKIVGIVNNSAASLSAAAGLRRPSLPSNLSGLGGSTTSLNSTYSNVSNSPISPGGIVDHVVSPILALPTAANTREQLITWILQEKRLRLKAREGWWIVKPGSVDGPTQMSDSLAQVEMACIGKGQHSLVGTFKQVRSDLLLPNSPVLSHPPGLSPSQHRRPSVPDSLDPRRASSRATERFVVDRDDEVPSPSGLRAPPRPQSGLRNNHDSRQDLETGSSSDRPQSIMVAAPDRKAQILEEAGLGIAMDGRSRSIRFGSEDSAHHGALSVIESQATAGSESGSGSLTRSGGSKRNPSRLSGGSSLEMASIIGTRAESRLSYSRGLDEENEVVDVLEPVDEEENDLAIPRGSRQSSSMTPARYRFPALFNQGQSPASAAPPEAVQTFQTHPDAGEVSPYPSDLPVSTSSTELSDLSSNGKTELPSKVGQNDVLHSPVCTRPTAPPLRLDTTFQDTSSAGNRPPPTTTLGLILSLFGPDGKVFPHLTVSNLRVVLLNVIDHEQRMCSRRGKPWTRADAYRLGWIIDEVRQLINLSALDSLFNDILDELDQAALSNQGTLQSLAQLSTVSSLQSASPPSALASYTFPSGGGGNRHTFGPFHTPLSALEQANVPWADSSSPKVEPVTKKSVYSSPAIPASGQLRLVGTPVIPAQTLSTIESNSSEEGRQVAEDEDDLAGLAASTPSLLGERERRRSGLDSGAYANSKAGSVSTTSLQTSSTVSGQTSGRERVTEATGLQIGSLAQAGPSTTARLPQPASEGADQVGSPISGRWSFENDGLKEAPPPPYIDPVAAASREHGEEPEAATASAGGA